MIRGPQKSDRLETRTLNPKIRAPTIHRLRGVRPALAATLLRERIVRAQHCRNYQDGPEILPYATRSNIRDAIVAFLRGGPSHRRKRRDPNQPRRVVCVWADVASHPMCTADVRAAHAWAREAEDSLMRVLESSGHILAIRMPPVGISASLGKRGICIRMVCDQSATRGGWRGQIFIRGEERKRRGGAAAVVVSVPARPQPDPLPIQLLMRVRLALSAPETPSAPKDESNLAHKKNEHAHAHEQVRAREASRDAS